MMAIALATFKEALRKKMFLLVGIITAVYLGLFTLIVHFFINDVMKFTQDSFSIFSNFTPVISILGLYFSSMLVAFLTIMSSIGSISSELESGVLHAVLTKPVRRSSYVFGKLAGLGMLSACYAIFLYSAVMLIPYIMGIPLFDNIMTPASFLEGLLLFVFQPLAILSLALFGGVRFKTLNNGIFVIALYILGLIGNMMEQIGSIGNIPNLVKWGIASSLISPFDAIYRKMMSIAFSGYGFTNMFYAPTGGSSTVPSTWMMAYTFVYTGCLILLAVRHFGKKDL